MQPLKRPSFSSDLQFYVSSLPSQLSVPPTGFELSQLKTVITQCSSVVNGFGSNPAVFEDFAKLMDLEHAALCQRATDATSAEQRLDAPVSGLDKRAAVCAALKQLKAGVHDTLDEFKAEYLERMSGEWMQSWEAELNRRIDEVMLQVIQL
ncbi:hypothetical protein JCM8097_001941 [Rhodosporidiobolus ruineniae]